jgi:hypothetical protein
MTAWTPSVIHPQHIDTALDDATERHIAHLFDVLFQSTDDDRFERFKHGMKRVMEPRNRIANEELD